MSALDPYYLVKDEIEDSVEETKREMGKWGRLLETSSERANLTKKLISTCDTIKWQLDELDKAIRVAERDPIKFSVNIGEIQRRKAWTTSTRGQVSNFRKTLQFADDALRIPHVAPIVPMKDAFIQNVPPPKSHHRDENDDYIQGEQDRQTHMLKEQDEDLDELSHSINRMGEVGLAIHDELGSQELLIADFSHEVETVSSRLDYVQKKMEHLIKRAGAKGQLAIIAFLMILFIILILLVFYT